MRCERVLGAVGEFLGDFLVILRPVRFGPFTLDTDTRQLLASLPECTGRMVLFEPKGKSLLTGDSEGISRWAISGSPMVSRISVPMRSRISAGVPLGAQMPYQDSNS